MAIKTFTEQLESVQSTITKIETSGQAYDVEGRRLTRADLKTLYDREKWLRRRAAREDRGGARTRQVSPNW